MPKRRTLGAEKARTQFAARMEAARRDGEHTVVLNRSKPAVVMVPASWYHRVSALAGEPWEDWDPEDLVDGVE